MSTFLALGFTLDQVIAMTTFLPGKVIDRNDKLGTLQIGAPADVSVLELTEAPTRFVDTFGQVREGQSHLRAGPTIARGERSGRSAAAATIQR